MKFLFLSLTFVFSSLTAAANGGREMALTPPQLSFRYLQQEGGRAYSCTHKAANDTGYDWDVTCGDGRGFVRNFGVHIVVNAYSFLMAPKLRYEVLFWVTARDLRMGQGKYVGSTTWFNISEPSVLDSVDVSQDVEEIWSFEGNIKLSGGTFRAMNPAARRRLR